MLCKHISIGSSLIVAHSKCKFKKHHGYVSHANTRQCTFLSFFFLQIIFTSFIFCVCWLRFFSYKFLWIFLCNFLFGWFSCAQSLQSIFFCLWTTLDRVYLTWLLKLFFRALWKLDHSRLQLFLLPRGSANESGCQSICMCTGLPQGCDAALCSIQFLLY